MATYTKSLVQKSKEEQKELLQYYKITIKNNLRLFFQTAIEYNDYNEAIIDLLENRLTYADELATEIYNMKQSNGRRLFDDFTINNIFDDILKDYNKELTHFKKTYNMEQKAKKDYYTTKLYNMIIEDIEDAKRKGAKIENIRKAVTTSKYKKIIQKDFTKLTRYFDKDIFDSVYNLTINKALRVYKNDETNEEQQIKIPTAWKVYGVTKVISKITGAKL